jgi:hypothetical protein
MKVQDNIWGGPYAFVDRSFHFAIRKQVLEPKVGEWVTNVIRRDHIVQLRLRQVDDIRENQTLYVKEKSDLIR